MPSEADQIRAPGVPITLRDGSARRLRFGFLAIKRLEEHFGSTTALDRELQSIAAYLQGKATDEGKVFTTVFIVMASGLVREHLTDEQLDDLLDFSKVHEYAVATNAALTQAFGEVGEEEANQTGKAAAVKQAGRGVNGGTRRRSSSAAKTKSSGETPATPE